MSTFEDDLDSLIGFTPTTTIQPTSVIPEIEESHKEESNNSTQEDNKQHIGKQQEKEDKTNLEELNNYQPNLLSDTSDTSDIKNPISVTQSIRLHSGERVVKGTIASISRLYKMVKSVTVECHKCSINHSISYPIPILERNISLSKCIGCRDLLKILEIDYTNAVTIQLQDSDTLSEIERLSCILFDENTKNMLCCMIILFVIC